jgi:hypothetical protein
MEMRDAEVKGKEIRVPSADKVWMGVWVCLKLKQDHPKYTG